MNLTNFPGDVWHVKGNRENRYLVITRDPGFVYEVNAATKEVSRWPMSFPALSAVRLRDGHLLLAPGLIDEEGIIEIDRCGRRLWEASCPEQRATKEILVCFELVRLGFDRARLGTYDLDSADYRIPKLRDKDPNVRLTAAAALARLGPKSEPAIPALVETLGDSDQSVRDTARRALSNINSPAAVPHLIKSLKHSNVNRRANAAVTLGTLHIYAHSAVPELINGIRNDNDSVVRRVMVGALESIGLDTKPAVQALVVALRDQSQEVRCFAASALGKSRSNSELLIPALADALKGSDIELREFAARALAALPGKDEKVLPILLDAFTNGHNHPRYCRRGTGGNGASGRTSSPGPPGGR